MNAKQNDTMIANFVKFPTTPHLLWLGAAHGRKDKVLSRTEASAFLQHPVVVEEKIDGANLGISFDAQGKLLAQSRGSFIDRATRGQFAPLWRWLAQRETPLFDILEDRLILFGEWCYARHSIHYTRLPDFLLAFDIFDRKEQYFLSSIRRNEILKALQVATVPRLCSGIFQLSDIPALIGQSALYDGPMEGIYLRMENGFRLIQRAKVVRPEFVQEIGEHWSKGPINPNTLQKA